MTTSTIFDHRNRPVVTVGKETTYYRTSPARNQQAGRRSQALPEDALIGGWTLQRMRLEALDLARTNPIVASVSSRIADNVIGSAGILPQCKTPDAAWNNAAEAFARDWFRSPDFRGRLNMRQMQNLVIQARLFQGDMAYNPIEADGTIQPIEADRIATPKKFAKDPRVCEGVRMDKFGRALGFYVLRRDDKGRLDPDKFDYLPKSKGARLVGNPNTRFERVRSMPDVYPICDTLRDFDELTEAQLNKVKMDAATGQIITKPGGAANIPSPVSGDWSGTTNNGKQKVYEDFSDLAKVYYLNEGESRESFSSAAPNPQFVEYCELELRLISSALGMPYEFVILDFKKGSFSSNKTAGAQVARALESYHSWLVTEFIQPSWEWRVAKAIREGDLPPAPMDQYGRSTWHMVEWSQPVNDWESSKDRATSNEANWRMGAMNLDDIVKKSPTAKLSAADSLNAKGNDILIASMEADRVNKAAEAAGIESPGLTWKDFIQASKPGEVQAQPVANNQDDD